MKRHLLVSAVLIAAVVGFLILQRPAVVKSQALPRPDSGQQFRIVMGRNDTTARKWNGKLELEGGDILSLKGWHFSAGDQAGTDGSFSFETRMGMLEDQLRPGSYYGQTTRGVQPPKRLIPEGLILKIRGNDAVRVSLQTNAGAFSFDPQRVSYGSDLLLMDGDISVERLPMEQKLSETGPMDDDPSVAIGSDGKVWVAWLSYKDKADRLLVSDGSQVYPIGESGDLHAPAIAGAGHGSIYVVWSRNENGAFHLRGAAYEGGKWGRVEQITEAGGNDIWPRLAGDGQGHMALTWQAARHNHWVILARLWNGKHWGPERQISEDASNCWMPVVAYGKGKIWFAWDSYATGSYQIYARELGGPVERVTRGDDFSVRASVAVAPSGQPVIAWEESDPLWGKDFAFNFVRTGTTLYKNRRVRVAYLSGGDWLEIAAPVADAIPREMRRFIQQPILAIDPGGRLYLSVRVRTSARLAREDFFATGGRWETYLTQLDGQHWTPAILMPSSVGRNSMRAALALDGSKASLAWPTDGRTWTSGNYQDLDVYTTSLPASGNPAWLADGKAIVAAGPPAQNPNPNEAADIRRVEGYQYTVGGKQYRILRGDFHRHTELSSDGSGDGMLDDNYRYTMDAAGFDIGFVSDHQMGMDNEYNWWITQKSNDLYYMPHRFVPMYGYERSVPYPNGHRNVMWATRGEPVLPISNAEKIGKINSGSVVYPYAHETGAIVMSHTTATDQGTDWRDNDPTLEPVVEIFQGLGTNAEEPGAPRAPEPQFSPSHGAEQPAGFIWNAWAKGYKLGVQASSDHISTHDSYACVITNQFTRQGILDAIRKRHTYAATDNIIMDFRIGTAMMGDIVNSSVRPKLTVKVFGTAPIKRIVVVKNNKYVHAVAPNSNDAQFEYLDNDVQPGESYYYVRAEQVDGQLAWSSPIWITYTGAK